MIHSDMMRWIESFTRSSFWGCISVANGKDEVEGGVGQLDKLATCCGNLALSNISLSFTDLSVAGDALAGLRMIAVGCNFFDLVQSLASSQFWSATIVSLKISSNTVLGQNAQRGDVPLHSKRLGKLGEHFTAFPKLEEIKLDDRGVQLVGTLSTGITAVIFGADAIATITALVVSPFWRSSVSRLQLVSWNSHLGDELVTFDRSLFGKVWKELRPVEWENLPHLAKAVAILTGISDIRANSPLRTGKLEDISICFKGWEVTGVLSTGVAIRVVDEGLAYITQLVRAFGPCFAKAHLVLDAQPHLFKMHWGQIAGSFNALRPASLTQIRLTKQDRRGLLEEEERYHLLEEGEGGGKLRRLEPPISEDVSFDVIMSADEMPFALRLPVTIKRLEIHRWKDEYKLLLPIFFSTCRHLLSFTLVTQNSPVPQNSPGHSDVVAHAIGCLPSTVIEFILDDMNLYELLTKDIWGLVGAYARDVVYHMEFDSR